MATTHPRKTLEQLTPEQRAAIEALAAATTVSPRKDLEG